MNADVVAIPFACAPAPHRADDATLDFFIGPENGILLAALQAVLAGPSSWFNPLVFVGRAGLGKSHLAHGIVEAWRRRQPEAHLELITANDFSRDLDLAIETGSVANFRERYRNADLLAIEDLEQIVDRPVALLELQFTLDTLLEEGKQALATCASPPGEMLPIPAALRSRLSLGLCVPLATPSKETLANALEALVSAQGWRIDQDAAELLVEASQIVPDLRRAIAHFTLIEPTAGLLDRDAVTRMLRTQQAPRAPSLSQIAQAVARRFSIKLSQLRGESRMKSIAAARSLAMSLARELTTHSFEEIGEYFGGRNHATVMHAVRRAEELVSAAPELAAARGALQERLLAG